MQTNISAELAQRPGVDVAESILRKCVHCGFCLATCPTYNLLGDELDSPRGRIYQIKLVLEGQAPTTATQQHLDRCLTCRNCETTCPSGVEYARLLDVGRDIVEESVARPASQRLKRWLVRQVLPYPSRIGPLVKLGQWFKPVLPGALGRSVPARSEAGDWPGHGAHDSNQGRRMLVLAGCVQPSMTPAVNAAAARVLSRLGIALTEVSDAGCCGAIDHHLNAQEKALERIRRNIDAWWPEIEAGAEAIVMTASGCGAMVKEYGHLLANDAAYASKAVRIAALTRDISEVLLAEGVQAQALLRPAMQLDEARRRVAFHPPCTLQHGQKLHGAVEGLLAGLGFELQPVDDAQECCGSAGTYSIFQPELSHQLRDKKAGNLQRSAPSVIATANIGCALHLQAVAEVPVRHWIELVDSSLS